MRPGFDPGAPHFFARLDFPALLTHLFGINFCKSHSCRREDIRTPSSLLCSNERHLSLLCITSFFHFCYAMMRLPCCRAVLLGSAVLTGVRVQAQPPPLLTPVDASECPLTCLNGSTCGRHTPQSQGVAFDAETGQVYWHERNSDRIGYRCLCPPGLSGLVCGQDLEICNPDAPPGLELACE